MAKTTTSKKDPEKKPSKSEGEKRAEARKRADDQAKKVQHIRKPIKGEKMIKVIGLVNMCCMDGCRLEVGFESEITEVEAKRLEADQRGPFYKTA